MEYKNVTELVRAAWDTLHEINRLQVKLLALREVMSRAIEDGGVQSTPASPLDMPVEGE